MIMGNETVVFGIFVLTVALVLWRPRGINEAVPVALGALAFFTLGVVPFSHIHFILQTVSGASVTILCTIVMSLVLESVGFFRWAALNLACKANGSGIALFWYINLLCFFMTLFFNNDGSILITTPIIIQTLFILNLKMHQKIPYLLSGALIATGSSAPIGVSNLANLIALEIVGLDLNSYAAMMFVPSMFGIFVMALLMFLYFRKHIPRKIMYLSPDEAKRIAAAQWPSLTPPKRYHPLLTERDTVPSFDWRLFHICISIVVMVRASYFLLAPFGIPTEWPSILGALMLLAVRWIRQGIGPKDIIVRTPWHILVFAFGMYVLVYGLHNIGFSQWIIAQLEDVVGENRFQAIFSMGMLLTVMSNLCNNLPSVMIGTLAITEMEVDVMTTQVAYLASVIGADIGSLLIPIGTLASLIWMHILRQYRVGITWRQYVRATFTVIPVSLLVSLISLYVWTEWLILD